MDIYQETYEQIQKKISAAKKSSTKVEAEFDMFSDNFNKKEQNQAKDDKSKNGKMIVTNLHCFNCKNDFNNKYFFFFLIA